ACRFMKPEGCGIYEDRPTACRYYPVALLSMRKQDEYVDRDSYAIVKEDHCKGHEVNRRITIADYRKEQGLEEYDELARGWRQLVLKKQSSGPSIGKPTLRSRQLYFMACYDIDRFREFVSAESFNKLFDLPPEEKAALLVDDVALLQFAFRFLRQVLFGEESIALNAEAAQERLAKVQEKRLIEEREAAKKRALESEAEGDEGFD
ncbi:MAG: YkgJ family cysteine cluster protein, partial [Sulfuritalea sp.]|nr:YkgJ family cysteine cluster protein [Sulfuritalea sp.]